MTLPIDPTSATPAVTDPTTIVVNEQQQAVSPTLRPVIRTGFHVFQDEQGSWSFARVALGVYLIFILALITWDVLHARLVIDNGVWAILTSISLALIAWAGGSRIAAYLFPQIGGLIAAVGSALQGRKAKDPNVIPGPAIPPASPPGAP